MPGDDSQRATCGHIYHTHLLSYADELFDDSLIILTLDISLAKDGKSRCGAMHTAAECIERGLVAVINEMSEEWMQKRSLLSLNEKWKLSSALLELLVLRQQFFLHLPSKERKPIAIFNEKESLSYLRQYARGVGQHILRVPDTHPPIRRATWGDFAVRSAFHVGHWFDITHADSQRVKKFMGSLRQKHNVLYNGLAFQKDFLTHLEQVVEELQ